MSEPTAPHDHRDHAGDAAVHVERRAWVRQACHLEAECRTLSDNPSEVRWQAVVGDIAAGGAGLVLGRDFRPGSVLALELRGAGGQPVELFALVRHSRRQGNGRWLVGCEFARKLDDAELDSLL